VLFYKINTALQISGAEQNVIEQGLTLAFRQEQGWSR
jgi:hypothetical protein